MIFCRCIAQQGGFNGVILGIDSAKIRHSILRSNTICFSPKLSVSKNKKIPTCIILKYSHILRNPRAFPFFKISSTSPRMNNM